LALNNNHPLSLHITTFYQSIIQTLLIGFYQYTSKQLDIQETAETASSVSFL